MVEFYLGGGGGKRPPHPPTSTPVGGGGAKCEKFQKNSARFARSKVVIVAHRKNENFVCLVVFFF